MGKTAAPQPQAKRSNIYRVTTTIEKPGGNEPLPIEKVEYVRAKTKAGAEALVAAERIKAELARPEDLLKLANISVKGD